VSIVIEQSFFGTSTHSLNLTLNECFVSPHYQESGKAEKVVANG